MENPKKTFPINNKTCPVVQLVASLTADRVIASSIVALSHTFVEIDHEIISTVIHLLPHQLQAQVCA